MYAKFFKLFSTAKPSFKGLRFSPLFTLTAFSLAAFHSKKYFMDD